MTGPGGPFPNSLILTPTERTAQTHKKMANGTMGGRSKIATPAVPEAAGARGRSAIAAQAEESSGGASLRIGFSDAADSFGEYGTVPNSHEVTGPWSWTPFSAIRAGSVIATAIRRPDGVSPTRPTVSDGVHNWQWINGNEVGVGSYRFRFDVFWTQGPTGDAATLTVDPGNSAAQSIMAQTLRIFLFPDPYTAIAVQNTGTNVDTPPDAATDLVELAAWGHDVRNQVVVFNLTMDRTVAYPTLLPLEMDTLVAGGESGLTPFDWPDLAFGPFGDAHMGITSIHSRCDVEDLPLPVPFGSVVPYWMGYDGVGGGKPIIWVAVEFGY